MRVFGCTWKINFSEIIFSWPGVLKALTRKLFEVKIFTSNHFRTHAQRERERAQITPQTELQSDDHRSSNPTTTDWSRHIRPHQRQSTPSLIKQRSTPTPLDLASTARSDEFFFWVLFLLCFCIEEWYYIFVWQLRKCDQQVENVFFIVFSRTRPNTRKYFSKHFLKCN